MECEYHHCELDSTGICRECEDMIDDYINKNRPQFHSSQVGTNMTPEQFVYWLQGFFEMTDPGPLTQRQAQIIRDHLAMVLNKKTPTREYAAVGDPPVVSMEEILEENPLFIDKNKVCHLTC